MNGYSVKVAGRTITNNSTDIAGKVVLVFNAQIGSVVLNEDTIEITLLSFTPSLETNATIEFNNAPITFTRLH